MEHCYPLLICVAWLKSTSAQINFQHLKNDKVNKIQLTQKWITEVKTSTCIERYSKKKKKKTKASQQKEKINNKSKEPTKQRIINTVFQNRFWEKDIPVKQLQLWKNIADHNCLKIQRLMGLGKFWKKCQILKCYWHSLSNILSGKNHVQWEKKEASFSSNI